MKRLGELVAALYELPTRDLPPAAPAPRPGPMPARVAAAGAVVVPNSRVNGADQVGWGFGPPLQPFDFPDWYAPWWDRTAAMSLPTISRGRDLICNLVAQLPFTLWTRNAGQVPVVERQVPGPSWFERPDPNRTRQWLLSWTTDDLIFHGLAHWVVRSRYATGYPATFERVAPGQLETRDDGTAVVTDDWGKRTTVPWRDVVEFLSPVEALLSNGFRAISIALQLDAAADRFAGVEVPAGVLEEQDGSEDLSADELAKIAADFSAARRTNTTAATNKYVRYRETAVNADDLQLVDSRTYQALELARLANVPPYLVGAPAGTGMTYQNGQQARQDLVDFGAAAYLGCIEQTLSGPNVTPAGQAVRLDLNVWLRNPFTTDGDAVPSLADVQIADPTQPPTAPVAP